MMTIKKPPFLRRGFFVAGAGIMARIDDYINAKKISVEKLLKGSFDKIALQSEFETKKGNLLIIPFLNRIYNVSYPDFNFEDEKEKDFEVPIQEQVLILHYLMSESISKLSGRWVAYREIQGASFYFSAFVKRAIDPLKKVFGNNAEGLIKAAKYLDGMSIEPGDAAFEFKVFPRVPVQLILWQGDNEFPPEANILFDQITGEILSPEDIAWLAGMLVYRLIALSR